MRAAVLAAALAELIRAAQQPKVADYSCLFSLSPPHLHPVYSVFFFFPAVNGIILQTRSFQGRWDVTLS